MSGSKAKAKSVILLFSGKNGKNNNEWLHLKIYLRAMKMGKTYIKLYNVGGRLATSKFPNKIVSCLSKKPCVAIRESI